MHGRAYYNEIDPYAAQWLRKLIAAGHIAPGDVDERNIVEVKPDDLAGYTQCHFFAGIGVWSYSLRSARWADTRPAWTGSCPCQPFSSAGKGDGAADPRHLWPAWFKLIRECAPGVIFGEQVASADGLAWLDLVHADLEEAGYAVGALDLCAAGAGAPHIRQRLYFVADANRPSAARQREHSRNTTRAQEQENVYCGCGGISPMADANHNERGAVARRTDAGSNGRGHTKRGGNTGTVGHAIGAGLEEWRCERGDDGAKQPPAERAGGTFRGAWADSIWLACRDGKQRPAPPEPEFQPLAYGSTQRVGRLRAYGNAICAPLAQAFIAAYMTDRAEA